MSDAPDARSSTRDLEALRGELLYLANEKFPAVAKTGGYPVRFNHCFLRIVYDNLFGARWQTVLPNPKDRASRGQAAYKQLDAEQLSRAIEIGERIIDDPEACRELNRKSLNWRGK